MRSHEHSQKGHWISAKKVQPEDFRAPFELRIRVDPPPGLEFWDRPLWIFGECEGQDASEHPTIALTHHADNSDGRQRHNGLPLKILFPVLIDFAAEVAEERLLIKIDLRNLEIRPTVTPEAGQIKADRRKYPGLAEHGWKK
jgi:hypothetical protein